ncbi:hypothetical protein [Elizabethkingia anophelis]|uniref:hypothetical protein n=1 Tax=Elizabethkingia anophelis TaxID=1117645 RepID=UPI000999579C|nr:hypothetical protein [Elizabethkingia anophelis]OPC30741.1 hypothetical protein BAX98_09035 [Elizabethkingia anophelis]
MKHLILLLTISLLFVACGTRQREVNLSKEEIKTKIESSGSEKSKTEENTKSEKQNTSAGESSGSVEKSTSEKGNVITDHTAEKNSSEKQSEVYTKTSKTKEYYENGNPKSESETSENMSKEIYRLTSELDNYKTAAQSAKNDVTRLTAENRQLTNDKETLITNLKNQKEQNSKLKTDNTILKKNKDSKVVSNRDSWWLYILLVVIGFGSGLYVSKKLKLK